MPAGKSILERLWEELDSIVDHIMSEDEPEVSDFDSGVQYQDIATGEAGDACKRWGEWRGQAQGVAYAIAMMTDPYAPDIEAIRSEAVDRWERAEEE